MRVIFLVLVLVGLFYSKVYSAEQKIVTLLSSENVRALENEVLEVITEIPWGTKLKIEADASPVFLDYRNSRGEVKRSTNGFYPVRVFQITEEEASRFPQTRIDEINEKNPYITSLAINAGDSGEGLISALNKLGQPDARFLRYFSSDHRFKSRQYVAAHQKRFGENFNRAIDLGSLPERDQIKWQKIYHELQVISDRTVDTPRAPIFIDSGNPQQNVRLARHYSEHFENTGVSQVFGAWTIAVLGTAPRHGFGNVPCAEFVSEIVRQAYTRAGYDMKDDFRGGNYLIWSNTAAVVDLTRALSESGWIPWDPTRFIPPTGSLMMHASATWPGHSYVIAGENGRFIIDNGSPKGRDLYKTSSSHSRDIIEMMYQHGVFFLPPGIIPLRWP